MEELCGSYWYPLYAYIRRKGHSAAEAEDLTQGFFAQFIERECLAGVRREKGRFRTFLLVCLKNYLTNVRAAEHAAKRGGGRKMLSIDATQAEERYRFEPQDVRTAERLYERSWAIAVLESALASVKQEFEARGRGRIFDALKIYLTGDELAPTYAQVAGELQMSESAVKVAVYRLRERYRAALEEEIQHTLDAEGAEGAERGESAMDREIGELLQALADEGRRA
jgi:RNA polymerase sigma-70 factor (ECF subfamily)